MKLFTIGIFVSLLFLGAPLTSQAGDKVVESKKKYVITESALPDGQLRYVWVTKDNRRGSSSSKRGARKAAKAALEREKKGVNDRSDDPNCNKPGVQC